MHAHRPEPEQHICMHVRVLYTHTQHTHTCIHTGQNLSNTDAEGRVVPYEDVAYAPSKVPQASVDRPGGQVASSPVSSAAAPRFVIGPYVCMYVCSNVCMFKYKYVCMLK